MRVSHLARSIPSLILLPILAGCILSVAQAGVCPAAWDKTFQGATRIFMPQGLKHEWRLLKAQALTESACRDNVCSHVGACGVMQIMEATWSDLNSHDHASIFDPKMNIIEGVKYQAWQTGNWLGRDRTGREAYELGAAGYNAGLGNILKAQARCGGARLWDDVASCLPQITGRHSKETIEYVKRIERWEGRLK